MSSLTKGLTTRRTARHSSLASHPRWGWLVREFRIDKRVSLSVAMGWLVLASLAFGVCGLLQAPPDVYVLILLCAAIATASQIRFPAFPRIVSALAGAAALALWALLCELSGQPVDSWPATTDPDFIWVLVLGALAGYVAGTLVTGVFLVETAVRSLSPTSTSHPRADELDTRPAGEMPPTAVADLAQRRRAEQ